MGSDPDPYSLYKYSESDIQNLSSTQNLSNTQHLSNTQNSILYILVDKSTRVRNF
jgi:hypothetical protein